SSLGEGGNAIVQPAIGFAKGAGETIENTVGRVTPGKRPPKQALEATNPLQIGGKIEEGIAEFLMSDNAAKGIPLLQRAESGLKGQKALKVAAEESPIVQNILILGLKALRSGVVSGAQSAAHDPTPASAGTGALFGVGGELGSEAAAYGISKLIPRT